MATPTQRERAVLHQLLRYCRQRMDLGTWKRSGMDIIVENAMLALKGRERSKGDTHHTLMAEAAELGGKLSGEVV